MTADAVHQAVRVLAEPGVPPVLVALAQARLAIALASEGRSDDARKLAAASTPALVTAGATPLLQRIEQLTGEDGRNRPASRRLTGWESITASERRVADLVAAGLSNPEIARQLYISRNTVQTHLSHIYDKLGLRSRTELVAAVLQPPGP